MKTSVVYSLLATFAAGLVAASSDAVSYTGYQVLRIKTLGHLAEVQKKLSTISYQQWEDTDTHVDIVVSPDQLEKLQSLGLDYRTLHQDLETRSKKRDGRRLTADAMLMICHDTIHTRHTPIIYSILQTFTQPSQTIPS